MTISFTCPRCLKPYELDAKLAGHRARCKQCRAEFTIPAGSRSPSASFPDEPEFDPYGLDEPPQPAPRFSSVAEPVEEEEAYVPRVRAAPKRRKRGSRGDDQVLKQIGVLTAVLIGVGAIIVVARNAHLVPAVSWSEGNTEHDRLVKEILASSDEMGQIAEEVTDEASARAAAPRMKVAFSRMVQAFHQMLALPDPSPSEDQRLGRAYNDRLEASGDRFRQAMDRIKANPAVAQALMEPSATEAALLQDALAQLARKHPGSGLFAHAGPPPAMMRPVPIPTPTIPSPPPMPANLGPPAMGGPPQPPRFGPPAMGGPPRPPNFGPPGMGGPPRGFGPPGGFGPRFGPRH